jgi:hypothetical protein
MAVKGSKQWQQQPQHAVSAEPCLFTHDVVMSKVTHDSSQLTCMHVAGSFALACNL